MFRSAIYAACAVSAAAILILSAEQSYADIYRFVDDNGVVHFSNVPQGGGDEVVVREKPARRRNDGPVLTPSPGLKKESQAITPEGVRLLDEEVPYASIINTKCAQYGVEPSLVRAIIKAESDFNPSAVSNKGAVGLMQLMPETAAFLGVKDMYDPEQNIDGGVRYVRYLLDNFDGDVELTVAAYNCGEGRVLRNGNCVPEIKETKNYVKKVMRLSNNPITGASFSRPIYKIELGDGSIMFTDSPMGQGDVTLVQ